MKPNGLAAVSSRSKGAVAFAGILPLAILALLLSVGFAAAQGWQPFGFKDPGFIFEVPPGFEISETAENGRGASFEGPDGAYLAVWGADLARRDFRAQIDSQMAQDRKDGWDLTYVRVTADWASYSGIRDDQIRYFRAITVCGEGAAVFVFDYPRSQKLAYDPVVVRLVRSLDAEPC
jgi:hypothetical protein